MVLECCLGDLVEWLFVSVQVLISGFWDKALCWALKLNKWVFQKKVLPKRMVLNIKILGTRFAYWHWGFNIYRSVQLTKQINICTYYYFNVLGISTNATSFIPENWSFLSFFLWFMPHIRQFCLTQEIGLFSHLFQEVL